MEIIKYIFLFCTRKIIFYILKKSKIEKFVIYLYDFNFFTSIVNKNANFELANRENEHSEK